MRTLDRDVPVGSAIDVWYDPDKPSRAVLEPGGEDWGLSAGAGAAAGLVGVVVLYVTARDETLRQAYERVERKRAESRTST